MSLPTPPIPSPSRSSITIRPATPLDAPSIALIGTTVFSASFGHSITPNELAQYFHDAYSPSVIAGEIASPDCDFVIALAPPFNPPNDRDVNSPDAPPGEIVGFAQLTRGTSEPCLSIKTPGTFCELQRLYVATGQQGRGIGNALLAAVEELARKQGLKGVWVGVWEENEGAMRLYERWGCRKVGEHGGQVGGVRDAVLWKDL